MQLCKLLPPAAKQNARLFGWQLNISARWVRRHTTRELTLPTAPTALAALAALAHSKHTTRLQHKNTEGN